MSCLTMCEYITKKPTGGLSVPNNYKCECHNITSEDGFVSQVARILSQKEGAPRPVFLQHGFFTTGMDWVSQPLTSDSLPYMLSDQGFDVWIGNNRGNIFSISNSKLDINTQEFWDAIDVDTMAKYDVPAIFDYVLETTKAVKMDWVGHSQGGGMILFALAMHDTLKDRLGTAALLAPGVYVSHMKVTLLQLLSKYHIDEAWYEHGFDIPGVATNRYYFPGPVVGKVMEFFTAHTPLCRLPILTTSICNDIGKLVGVSVGRASNIDWRTMADAYRYDPGGASFHLLMHYAQRVRNDTLAEFDWGANNSQHYNGSSTPPLFDLSKIHGTRLALFDGGADLFITRPDIESLLAAVPKENFVYHDSFENYAHMDFVWGKDAHTRLYPELINLLENKDVVVV